MYLVQSHRSHYNRTVSEHTVHYSWLCMGLRTSQPAHADSCPPLKAPTVGVWTSVLNHGTMEVFGLIWLITFSFSSCGWPGGMHHRKKASWLRQCDVLGKGLLGNHCRVLDSCNIVADEVHLFMASVFLITVAFFSRIRHPGKLQKLVWFKEHVVELTFKIPNKPHSLKDLLPRSWCTYLKVLGSLCLDMWVVLATQDNYVH